MDIESLSTVASYKWHIFRSFVLPVVAFYRGVRVALVWVRGVTWGEYTHWESVYLPFIVTFIINIRLLLYGLSMYVGVTIF